MRRVLITGWLFLAALGCEDDASGPGMVDSESHWLDACDADAQCGEGLACVCGICTRGCAGAQACADLGEAATCGLLPPACGVAQAACVRPCDDATQCAEAHLTCAGNVCAPLVSVQPPDGGPLDAAPDMRVSDAAAPADAAPVDADRSDSTPPDMRPRDAGPDMVPDMAAPVGECGHPDSACQSDDDCAGRPCSALIPSGPCQCGGRPQPPTRNACGDGCCLDADCPGGICQAEDRDAQDQLCGAMGGPANLCQAEVCARDLDCGVGRTCIRPGEHRHVRSACVAARCRADTDCDAQPGGRCLAFFTPCFVRGFACQYPGDPCAVDADCPQRGTPRVCVPLEGGGTTCIAVE